MSSSQYPSHDIILQHFSAFLSKLLHNNPMSPRINEDFIKLRQLLLQRPIDMSGIYAFLSNLNDTSQYQNTPQPQLSSRDLLTKKNSPPNPKVSSPLAVGHQNEPRETVEIDNDDFPYSSIKKFTLSSFKDYLHKYSIILSPSFPDHSIHILLNSSIRDFLPDSENFYRALGLGLIEHYLINPNFKSRLWSIHSRVQTEELILSSDAYPFSQKDLKDTLCGYIAHLLDEVETELDPDQIRELLFTMANRNVVFDVAIVSLIKSMIEQYFTKYPSEMSSNGSPRNLFDNLCNPQQKLRMEDSCIIPDLMEYLPKIFHISLVTLVVENKSIKYMAYRSRAQSDPNIYLLNERHKEYQNFALITSNLNQDKQPVMRLTDKPCQTPERLSLRNDIIEPSEIIRIKEHRVYSDCPKVFLCEGELLRKSGDHCNSGRVSASEGRRTNKGSSEDIQTTMETREDTHEEVKELRPNFHYYDGRENEFFEIYEEHENMNESPEPGVYRLSDSDQRLNPFRDVYNEEEYIQEPAEPLKQEEQTFEPEYRVQIKQIVPAFEGRRMTMLRVIDDEEEDESESENESGEDVEESFEYSSVDEKVDKSWMEQHSTYNRDVKNMKSNMEAGNSFECELIKHTSYEQEVARVGKENIYTGNEEVRAKKVPESIISESEIAELMKKYGVRKLQ